MNFYIFYDPEFEFLFINPKETLYAKRLAEEY